MRRICMKASVVAVAMLYTSLAFAENSTEPTVKLSGGSTAVGIGANWGEGILTFEGYEYPFSVRGLTIGDVGAHGFTGSGRVHNLKRAEDFNGNYTGLGVGLTIAGGGSAVTMRNQNGVTIDLLMTTRPQGRARRRRHQPRDSRERVRGRSSPESSRSGRGACG